MSNESKSSILEEKYEAINRRANEIFGMISLSNLPLQQKLKASAEIEQLLRLCLESLALVKTFSRAPIKTKNKNSNYRPSTRWSKDDEKVLLENYKNLPYKKIAKMLNRTYGAVCMRANILGIKRKSK